MAQQMPAILGGQPAIAPGSHRIWPDLTDADKAAVQRVLDRGVLSGPFAPEATALQEEFADWTGVQHCLMTHSGTSALHLSVAAAGIEAGDEVITTAFTFIATAMAMLHHQAVPVFVDIDPRTFNIDPAKIEAAITPRTKAIMPVHIHGLCADMDAIRAIADRHGLRVIEDAAQAHGATINGKTAGGLALSAGFSLQSSKNLSVGEGGLFVTDDTGQAERANRLRNFGENARPGEYDTYDPDRPLDGTRAYDSVQVGWMYRGQEMTAALGRSRLQRLTADTDRVRRNGERLSAGLADLPGIEPQFVPDGYGPVWHKYRVRLDPATAGVADMLPGSPTAFRDCLRTAINAEKMEAVLWGTAPVPAQELFQKRQGFGHGVPWSLPGRGPVDYDPSHFPRTQALLDNSLVLFSQSHPLIAQDDAVVDAYVAGLRRIWDHLPQIVAHWKDSVAAAASAG